MIININSSEEAIKCQKILFAMGYKWEITGKSIRKYGINYIHTFDDLMILRYTPNKSWEHITKNVVDFKTFLMIIREKKLSRILNDN